MHMSRVPCGEICCFRLCVLITKRLGRNSPQGVILVPFVWNRKLLVEFGSVSLQKAAFLPHEIGRTHNPSCGFSPQFIQPLNAVQGQLVGIGIGQRHVVSMKMGNDNIRDACQAVQDGLAHIFSGSDLNGMGKEALTLVAESHTGSDQNASGRRFDYARKSSNPQRFSSKYLDFHSLFAPARYPKARPASYRLWATTSMQYPKTMDPKIIKRVSTKTYGQP